MVTHASACVGSWTNDAKRDVGEGGEEATHTDAGQITTSPSLDSSASTEHRSSSYSPRWYPPTGEPDAGDLHVRFGGRGRSLTTSPYLYHRANSSRRRRRGSNARQGFDEALGLQRRQGTGVCNR